MKKPAWNVAQSNIPFSCGRTARLALAAWRANGYPGVAYLVRTCDMDGGWEVTPHHVYFAVASSTDSETWWRYENGHGFLREARRTVGDRQAHGVEVTRVERIEPGSKHE